MMTLFAYLLIGSVIAYGVFTILVELSDEIRYVRIEDDRDTEEKVIAGEDTSEVALNYLKLAARIENDNETR
jgi:hypothetical protein